MTTTDGKSIFLSTIVVPATFTYLLAMPAVLSAICLGLVLTGHLRGLAVLAIPVLLVKFSWDARSSWADSDPYKYALLSWIAGLPIGLIAWELARLIVA